MARHLFSVVSSFVSVMISAVLFEYEAGLLKFFNQVLTFQFYYSLQSNAIIHILYTFVNKTQIVTNKLNLFCPLDKEGRQV